MGDNFVLLKVTISVSFMLLSLPYPATTNVNNALWQEHLNANNIQLVLLLVWGFITRKKCDSDRKIDEKRSWVNTRIQGMVSNSDSE